jgi:CheY-like chemotaxis protein
VPADYRRILGFIDAETHADVVRGCLRQFPDKLLDDWLGELEEMGFLESTPETDEHDLDFAQPLFAEPKLLAEDQTRLEHDASSAGASLHKTGIYLSPDRLKNRAPSAKKPADTVVLIVEDDPDQLALADLRVSLAGYSVRAANSASALLASLRAHGAPDILLLDVELPDGNGFHILGQLRHNKVLALLPIIMLTAKDNPNDIKKGLAIGADGYVTKPYSKNVLADSIRRVLKQQ